MFNFSYVSWFFSLINLSLSKDGVEEEVDVLWALVFLTMMLRIGKDTQKRDKRKKKTNKKRKTKKTQGQTALDKVRAQEKKTIYMMHALMH